MIPILFHSTEREFVGNGIGRLSDCISCLVTEEINGVYECQFSYPVTGALFSELQNGRIVYTTHDQTKAPQPFTIYKQAKEINGIVTYYARHISYQLTKTVLKPFSANSCLEAMDRMAAMCYGDTPFTFWTDKNVTGSFKLTAPRSVRNALGGMEGSLLDVYGKAELEWDKWTVKLHLNRGVDTDVSIRYGKNLVSFTQDTDYTGTYNAVVPFWTSDTDGTVTLPEGYILTGGIPARSGYLVTDAQEIITDASGAGIEAAYFTLEAQPLDLSDAFEEKPSADQLREKALTKIKNAQPWKPSDNITVSFVNLADIDEYKNYAPLQTCRLCDTVSVYFTQYGVASQGVKIISVTWDALNERYSEMQLGDAKQTFSEVVTAQVQETIMKTVPTRSDMQTAIEHATDMIVRGGLGGHIVFTLNADGEPEEILVMDNADPALAVNVWRFNLGGLGHSHNGYNGPFDDVALTADGRINADLITAGTLNANIMQAGIIRDKAGKNYWNLETGEISISYDVDPEGGVTQADLARVEQNAKDYTNNATADMATQTWVSGQISITKDGINSHFQEVEKALDDSVVNAQQYQYKSTSPTELMGGSWTQGNVPWQDGYFIWQKTRYTKADGTTYESAPVCITGNTGADGDDGADALYLYVTANAATSTAKETPKTVTLTGIVGEGDEQDSDPSGSKWFYAWYKTTDGGEEGYYRKGKNQTITINRNFCEDVASMRFRITNDATEFYLTNQNGVALTTHTGAILEVE